MSDSKRSAQTSKLPLLPLRGVNVFPNTVLTLDVARDKSIGALQRALKGDQRVFVVAQRDGMIDRPDVEDLYSVGTVASIKQVMNLPDQSVRVLVEGRGRGLLLGLDEGENGQTAEYFEVQPIQPELTAHEKALMRAIRAFAPQAARSRGQHMPELMQEVMGEKNPSVLCDVIAANLLSQLEDKQAILECVDIGERMKLLLHKLADEIKIAELDERIQSRVREYMEQQNHEYYLREEIRAIQEELGEDEDEDILELRQRLAKTPMPKEAREAVEKELKRLARTAVHSPESAVSQNYIEYMLELPWGVKEASEINIKKARKVLEADHYGMEDVKQRLIEYLAVRSVAGDKLKSPIICLVGPPGVGKTSIARSIATALNRKFTRMSLGGVHDEAEIRGHRRTYVGAMPGRIVSAIHQCKTMNPVFLLDEIDKLSRDMRGDPASAMLEALDPEQNATFKDHYVETPFDLSDVFFITTANTTDTIDPALLDRMEIIEVPSYTAEEKLQIAKRHLLKKQREAHNLTAKQFKLPDKTLAALIDGYTREAGVRELERKVAQLCRGATLKLVEDPELTAVTVKPEDLKGYLGAPRYLRQPTAGKAEVGMVNGLAWTSVGGEVMPVECVTFPGKGRLKLTGKLGDVMKESAELAVSVTRGLLPKYGMPEDYFDTHDIHIHVPEGAVPKDGPSAGVALTCALVSAVTGRKASGEWAMTGEITLHGKVLPIGGVKEKLLAAYRMGIRRVLLPRENEKDLEKIDDAILGQFELVFMDDAAQALEKVILGGVPEAA